MKTKICYVFNLKIWQDFITGVRTLLWKSTDYKYWHYKWPITAGLQLPFLYLRLSNNRTTHSGSIVDRSAVLIQLGHPALQKDAEYTWPRGVGHVGNKADVKEDADALLQGF